MTRRTPRRAAGALMAAACGAALLTATPRADAATAPKPAPTVDLAQAAAQCAVSSVGRPQRSTDPADAIAIMAGRAPMRPYGTVVLRNITWKHQKTLDTSGNEHLNGLHWMLPVLREGERTGSTAMTGRFYSVLASYLRTFPGPLARQNKTNPDMWNPMDAGYRTTTLVCAVAGPRGNEPWVRRALADSARTLATNPRDATLTSGSNNTYLHAQLGLLSAACTLDDPTLKSLARARIGAVVARLVNPDGSDREGSLSYAVSDYLWLAEAQARLDACGLAGVSTVDRLDNVPKFVAQATRPDRWIENLGDAEPRQLKKTQLAGTPAQWAATAGASGTPTTDVFSSWQGGYVFGRSGWGDDCRAWADDTWYSVRTAPRRSYHSHDDTGSLTLYSHGSELLVDDGQYAYRDGSRRSYVVSRAAHNTLSVEDLRTAGYGEHGTGVTVRHTGAGDVVRVNDAAYGRSRVTLSRQIGYDRGGDFLVVTDRVTAPGRHTYAQHWQLPYGRGTQIDPLAGGLVEMSSTGSGANVSLFTLAVGPKLSTSAVKGRTKPSLLGWTSRSYGDFVAAPMLRAAVQARKATLVTVVVPRASGWTPSDVSVTATRGAGSVTLLVSTPAGDFTWLQPTDGALPVPQNQPAACP